MRDRHTVGTGVRPLLFGCVLIQSFLLGWGSWTHSPNWDEAGHLPAGLSHVEFGDFQLYAVNPPLVRTIAAIPAHLVPHETNWELVHFGPGSRNEFNVGANFLEANQFRSFWLFTVARWACIPFSWLGAWVCWRWATDLYGARPGFYAVVIWCFAPSVLAYGDMITPTIAAGSLGCFASYRYWRWLRKPTWSTAFASGAGLGLALLTKTTWLLFAGLWPVLWLVYRFGQEGRRSTECIQLCLTFVVAVYLLNAGYLFEDSGQRLGEFEFVSRTLTGIETMHDESPVAGNRFRETVLGKIPVPLPKRFVEGIDLQQRDFDKRMWSYLRGEWRKGGWWYYYLYAMVVKMPIGTHILIGIAVLQMLFGRSGVRWKDEIVLLAPAICVIVLVSSHTGFNHHLRYVFPAFPSLYILATRAFMVDMRKRLLGKVAVIALLWAVVSSLLVYPHSRSYFSELVGGPKEGHWHLGGSFMDTNLDCGQDLLYLKDWIEEHPEATPLYLRFMGVVDPRIAGIDLPDISESDFVRRRTADRTSRKSRDEWFILSVNHLHDREGRNEVFLHAEPVDYIGYSLRVYRMKPSQNRSRK